MYTAIWLSSVEAFKLWGPLHIGWPAEANLKLKSRQLSNCFEILPKHNSFKEWVSIDLM